MSAAGSRNPSRPRTRRERPCYNEEAVSAREVLKGEDSVKSLQEGETKRPQHECFTLHGCKEVPLCYTACKSDANSARQALLSHNKPGSSGATGNEELSCVDRFEVQIGRDTLVYAVHRLNASSAKSGAEDLLNKQEHQGRNSDTEDTKAIGEPKQRLAPCRSRILIYKRRDGNLEVDIPSYGVGLHTVFEIVCFSLVFSLVGFGTVRALSYTFSKLSKMRLFTALFISPLWYHGFFLVYQTIENSFIHENLTITPTNFRIKRTVQFWRRHRDSVNHAARAEAPLTWMDRIFCEQLAGSASDLTDSVKEHVSTLGRRSCVQIALLDEQRERKLNSCLSNEEGGWLCSEINATLREINDRPVPFEECTHA